MLSFNISGVKNEISRWFSFIENAAENFAFFMFQEKCENKNGEWLTGETQLEKLASFIQKFKYYLIGLTNLYQTVKYDHIQSFSERRRFFRWTNNTLKKTETFWEPSKSSV